jgi:hypothetical protein
VFLLVEELERHQGAQKAGRHVYGLSEGQHRTGEIRRDVHHVGHGAGVRRGDQGDSDEPDHQDELDVAAEITDHQDEQTRNHLSCNKRFVEWCRRTVKVLTERGHHFAHVGQGHDVLSDELVGRVAEENGGDVAADEGGSGQQSVLTKHNIYIYVCISWALITKKLPNVF